MKKKKEQKNINQTLTREHLGFVAVDSGQLIIVDPCYLKNWRDGEPDVYDNHYAMCCQANEHGGGEIVVSGMFGTGVTFPSGLGDGTYDVYAYKDENNRIKKIEIEF